MPTPLNAKDARRSPGPSYLIGESIRSFDGTELLRARESASDRPLLAKAVRDRNYLELAQWEHTTLATLTHHLLLRPLDVSRDPKDQPLFLYEAEEFVTAERGGEAVLDGHHLARELLTIVGALHQAGIARLGLDTSCVWLRPCQGFFTPVLVALRPMPELPLCGTFRPQASAHDRPRLRWDVAYLAPEILLGEEADARSDLYSVGAILYEMLSGLPPVNADDVWTALQSRSLRPPVPLAELRPDVAADLSGLVAKLLSFSPSERYTSARAALAELAGDAAAGGEVTAGVSGDAATVSPAAVLCSDFVGRSTAMERLQAGFETAATGSAQLVVLTGDEGLGKARLVDELLARLKLRGVATYRGRFLPDERALYFAPFAELFRALYPQGRRVPDGIEQVIAHLFPELVSGSRQRARGGRRGEAVSPRREQIHEALGQMVLTLSSDPICLILEQLSWDDPDHQALLNALVAMFAGKPVLLVVTLRPGTEPLKPSDGEEVEEEARSVGERIDLVPLSIREVGRVAATALGIAEVAEGDVGALHDECQGSPLLCLELLKSGRLGGEGGGATGAAPVVGPEDLLARRIALLSDDARHVLEGGAVLGEVFERQALARLVEMPEDDLWTHVAALAARDLLRPALAGHRMELSFPHPAYRRAVLKSATPARRSLLHLRAAHHLEGKLKRGQNEVVWDVAYHYNRGSDETKKARFNALAADRATELFAVDGALKFFKQGVLTGVADDKLDRVRPKLEGLLGLMGRDGEIRALYDAAPRAGVSAAPADVASLLDQGRQSLGATEYRKAARLLQMAFDGAEQGDDEGLLARAACELATFYRRIGSYDRSLDILGRALARVPQGVASALARADVGRVELLRGNRAVALESCRQAVEAATTVDDPHVEGYCRATLGRVMLAEGRHEAALSELLSAQQAVSRGGEQGGVAWVALALGAYFEEMRNDTEALAHYELAQRAGTLARTRVRGMIGASRSLTRLDRLPDADAKVQAALDACQAPGAFDLLWQAHAEAGRAMRMGGRLDEALLAYQRAVTAIESLMDQAPLSRTERTAFLKHDGRLKAFRGLLAVRLLIDKNPSLIEFAADDYLISLIDRFYDDRYRQRKKLTERLERMVEWILRNRDQIRMRRVTPPVEAQPRMLPPRPPHVNRLEGKNLLRMSAILDSLADGESMKAHLLDMALDIVDADRGLLAMSDGKELKASVVRELKGRDIDDAVKRIEGLKEHRGLDDVGPILSPGRKEGQGTSLILPLTKGDTLKGGIYIEGVHRIGDPDKKYLKGFAALAVMSLDTAREQERMVAELGRLAKENRKLQQDAARGHRDRDDRDDREVEADEVEEPRRSRRGRGRRGDRGDRGDRGRAEQQPIASAPEATTTEPEERDSAAPPIDVEAPVGATEGEGGDAPRLSRRARRAQEKQEIVDALKECEFNRKDAATRLGISRSTLNTRLRRYNIRIKRLREQAGLPPETPEMEQEIADGAVMAPDGAIEQAGTLVEAALEDAPRPVVAAAAADDVENAALAPVAEAPLEGDDTVSSALAGAAEPEGSDGEEE